MAGYSFLMALSGEEGSYLAAVYARGKEGLAAYRAYLEARGDPRGEALRLQDAVLAATSSEAAEASMRALRAALIDIDEMWWKCVDQLAPIRGCGRGGPLPVVRFAFVCSMRWEGLERTNDPALRLCGECEEAVYYCATRAEAEAHARAGHCITVPAQLAGAVAAEVTQDVLGRPDPVEMWGRRIFDER